MKQRQGPSQGQASPERQQDQAPSSDDQSLYGNAFCAEMVQAANDPPGSGGGGGDGGGNTPGEVFFIQWTQQQAAGAIAIMGVGPEPEDSYDALYEGLELHESFATPHAMRGHFSNDALNPALASEHGGTAASAAARFSLGDTSRTFPIDDADSFEDHHFGFGLPNPEWILPEHFANGIGWTVRQWYTYNGRRLRGTFTISRIGYFDGTNFRMEVTKE